MTHQTRLIDWLIDWSIDWLTDWLIDWLIDLQLVNAAEAAPGGSCSTCSEYLIWNPETQEHEDVTQEVSLNTCHVTCLPVVIWLTVSFAELFPRHQVQTSSQVPVSMEFLRIVFMNYVVMIKSVTAPDLNWNRKRLVRAFHDSCQLFVTLVSFLRLLWVFCASCQLFTTLVSCGSCELFTTLVSFLRPQFKLGSCSVLAKRQSAWK